MRRIGFATSLVACAAALLMPAIASAALRLPPGAGAPPELPPGVVPAERPPVSAVSGQRRSATAAAARRGLATAARSAGRPRRALWATVNVCDTERSPNALGIRASVPGRARADRTYVRFTAQWWSGARDEWLTVEGAGTSRWVHAGPARGGAARQAGWTFHLDAPPEGTAFVMRGVVEVSWRARRGQRRPAGGRGDAGVRRRAASRGRRTAGGRRRASSGIRRSGDRRRRASSGARRGRARHDRKHARRARLRARWAVVGRRTLLTETGMKRVRGGDPAGTSKAMCLIW